MYTVAPLGTSFLKERRVHQRPSQKFVIHTTALHILTLCMFVAWKPSVLKQSALHPWPISQQQGFLFHSRKHDTVRSKISKESKASSLHTFQQEHSLQLGWTWFCFVLPIIPLSWTSPVHHYHRYPPCGIVKGTVAPQLHCSCLCCTPSWPDRLVHRQSQPADVADCRRALCKGNECFAAKDKKCIGTPIGLESRAGEVKLIWGE